MNIATPEGTCTQVKQISTPCARACVLLRCPRCVAYAGVDLAVNAYDADAWYEAKKRGCRLWAERVVRLTRIV
jgi:hypothetical protein